MGSKTEQALLNFCKALGADYMKIRQARSRRAGRAAVPGGALTVLRARSAGPGVLFGVVQEVPVEQLFPFSSERKRMSTIVKHRDGNMRMYTKGASEIVLDYCTKYLTVREVASE